MAKNKKANNVIQLNNVKQRENMNILEDWVFQDKAILASIDKGMTEADNGQLIDKGSFAKYIND